MSVRDKKIVRMAGKVLFVLYIVFIIYFLLFSDWYGRSGTSEEFHYNLVLFREIRRFWRYRHQVGLFAMFTNLFGNVVIFVPFGFFMPAASRQRSAFAALVWSFGLSLCVEASQLVFRIGSFDVDDLFLNTVGGILGYMIFAACNAIRRKHGNRKKEEKYKRKQKKRTDQRKGKTA